MESGETRALSRKESQRQRDLLLIEHAADAAAKLASPGYIFTKAWLCEQFGLGSRPADTATFERWRTRYLTLVLAWREELGARHKVPTKTARGDGYKVLPPAEGVQTYLTESFQVVRNGIHTGIKRVETWIDADQLLPHERQERFDTLGRLRNLDHALKQARPRPPKLPVSPVHALPPPAEKTAAE